MIRNSHNKWTLIKTFEILILFFLLYFSFNKSTPNIGKKDNNHKNKNKKYKKISLQWTESANIYWYRGRRSKFAAIKAERRLKKATAPPKEGKRITKEGLLLKLLLFPLGLNPADHTKPTKLLLEYFFLPILYFYLLFIHHIFIIYSFHYRIAIVW